jgi:putative sterol carrier protein
MSTPAEIFEKIAAAAAENPEKATEADAVFQFDITGDGGGTYVLNMKQGTTENFLTREPTSDAVATISIDGADWSALVSGELDPMQAFMGGKIKIDGDMTAAMKLPGLLKLAR